MKMYYVHTRLATQINALGELKKLHALGKKPILVMDVEDMDGMWFIIALPKEEDES